MLREVNHVCAANSRRDCVSGAGHNVNLGSTAMPRGWPLGPIAGAKMHLKFAWRSLRSPRFGSAASFGMAGSAHCGTAMACRGGANARCSWRHARGVEPEGNRCRRGALHFLGNWVCESAKAAVALAPLPGGPGFLTFASTPYSSAPTPRPASAESLQGIPGARRAAVRRGRASSRSATSKFRRSPGRRRARGRTT